MSRLRPYPLLGLVIWSLVLWTGRLKLAWTATDDSVPAKLVATVPVVIFVVFALLVVGALLRRQGDNARSDLLVGWTRRLSLGLALWTVVYWLVRLPMILADDHELPFKAVHTVLAALSWSCAVWAWRAITDSRAPRTSAVDAARG